MADFLVVLGIVLFALAMLGLVWVQAILLSVSVLVFIYLGVAMFKPEKF
jgi:K+-transporting ATPase KdpF subunit